MVLGPLTLVIGTTRNITIIIINIIVGALFRYSWQQQTEHKI